MESYGHSGKRSRLRSQQARNRAPWHGQEGQLVHSGISGSQPGGFGTGSGIVSSDTESKVIRGSEMRIGHDRPSVMTDLRGWERTRGVHTGTEGSEGEWV